MSGHVLVVDDDPDIRGLLVAILQGEGWTVATATNGEEALARIAADRPRLVLLDLSMPRMSGWEVLATLQADQISVPVIVMTAGTRAYDAAAAMHAAGALSKPFELDDLLTIVARCTGRPDRT
ncbi:MAG TPA: response regulator [Dehalococcoidia bacterium]|jgi:two-component system response regulator MprA